MARRMFSDQIVDSDAFLDMPPTSQLLYFHLCMRADDDGFVGNPKKILRMIGGNDDDLKIILAKRFILCFESGVVVIKHWLIHNLIRGDRYHETQYLEEKSTLSVKENKSYTEAEKVNVIPNGNQMATQVRLGKVRLGKSDGLFEEFWSEYPNKVKKKKARDAYVKISSLEETHPKIMAALAAAKATEQWKKNEGKFVPHPTTWLNGEQWNDEIKDYREKKPYFNNQPMISEYGKWYVIERGGKMLFTGKEKDIVYK